MSEWRIVEATLPELERRMEQLAAIEAASSALDSEHIRNAPNLRPKLAALASNTAQLRSQLNQSHFALSTA